MIARGLGAGALVLAIGACSGPPEGARIGVSAPDRGQFDPVGHWLNHRCGSLDCHGDRQRNLVIFGCEGLRLDPSAVTGCRDNGGAETTAEELDASYRSLVGLEPAVMSTVVSGHGRHPELLTFVRKARGDEAHKGGTLIAPGDVQDTCITSWLAGTTNSDACATALKNSP